MSEANCSLLIVSLKPFWCEISFSNEVACLLSLFCHFVSLEWEVVVDSFEEDSLELFRILSFRSVFIAVSKIKRLTIIYYDAQIILNFSLF